MLDVVIILIFTLLFIGFGYFTYWYKPRINKAYHFIILKHKTIIHQQTFYQMLSLLVLLWFVNLFIPIPIISVFVIVFIITNGKLNPVETVKVDNKSEELLSKLNIMESQLEEVKQYIDGISLDLKVRDRELTEKSSIKQQLEKEIEEKSKEAEIWNAMTEEQRNLVVNAAAKAIPQKSKISATMGIILGLFLNILSTIIWTMIGNPGKGQILDSIEKIRNLLLIIK